MNTAQEPKPEIPKSTSHTLSVPEGIQAKE